MVVDVDCLVLELILSMLQQFHRVIDSFTSPRAALAAFTATPDTYELVVTDFDMPGMDGIELGRRMRAMASELKILMATGSGYVTDTIAMGSGFGALLAKPFSLTALRKALNKIGIEANVEQPD
jgi:CheY-like chemotaxis protein